MKRFSLITTALSLALFAGMLVACHNPSQTTVTSTATTSTTVTATTTEATTTTALTETTPTTPDETVTETTVEIIATATDTYVEDRHLAKGKFNYVLKNKEWKYDGEMYYHKYKDGTVVYYDKEAKSWFLVDKSGQGWYYDSDINDFVRDE